MPATASRRFLAPLIVLFALAPCTRAPAADDRAATTPPPPRPDLAVWGRRLVDLYRDAVARTDEQGGSAKSLRGVIFVTIRNPVLVRDPYREQVLAALAGARDADTRALAREVVPFLELPEAERWLRLYAERIEPARQGAIDARLAGRHDVARAVQRIPLGDRAYDAWAPAWIERMHDAGRDVGDWDGLASAYAELTDDAVRRRRPDRARRYADRMLAIVRAHPGVLVSRKQPPPTPVNLARVLARAGFTDDLATFLEALAPEQARDALPAVLHALTRAGRTDDARRALSRAASDLSVEDRAAVSARWIGALADAGASLDDLRKAIDRDLEPVSPPAAARLAAAVAGNVPPGNSLLNREVDFATRAAREYVADAHARAGHVETAARQKIALERATDSPMYLTDAGDLMAVRWAGLGHLAASGGHPDAAARAFDAALQPSAADPINPVEPERARFVREAVAVRDFDLARRLLSTSLPPGAWARRALARTCRARGDVVRANQLIEEALAVAPKGDEGDVTAALAADLHEAGETARAERVLLSAFGHVDGVDFGFSGAAAIVRAAVRMNRFDLLDRIYETTDWSRRILLANAATWAAVWPLPEETE